MENILNNRRRNMPRQRCCETLDPVLFSPRHCSSANDAQDPNILKCTELLPDRAGEAPRDLQGHIPSSDSPDQQGVLDAELND